MGDILDKAEHRLVWQILSYAFVDTEIDYNYIARKIANYKLEEIEYIFFNEVAPVCHPNFLAVIPPVWTFFEDEWLDEEIPALLNKSKQNAYQRLRYKIYVSYLRWACKDIWSAITDEVQKMKGSA